ncbi:MAG: outer membrane protein transport protein [Planctomycetaceae bacterium]|nr:outer membrane protein transport protein [Planctomycetaceae bacterium]
MSRSLTTSVALVVVFASRSLLADGLFLNGVSPRSIGRGGTNQGFADNGAIILENPAAMTNVEGRGLFDIGGDLLFTDFLYSDPANSRASSTTVAPLPQMSGIYKTEDGVFAFGLGVFVPAGFSQNYTMNGPAPFVGPQEYQSYGSLIRILPAVAIQLTEDLSIGGTLGVSISEVELRGPYALQSLGGLPTLTDLDVDGTGINGSIGLQYLLTETTTLGLTWQSQTNMDLKGKTNVILPGGLSSDYDTKLGIKWPQSVAFGVRQQLGSHVFAADLIWLNWGDSFDNYTIKLSNPSTPGFPPVVNDPLPLRWKDTLSVRLGYEYDLGDNQTLRLGYAHHPNPIPSSTLTPYIQAITQNAFSGGYGFRVFDWDVDLAYMFTVSGTERVGTSAFLGGDFSNSTHSGQTHAACLNLIKRF